MGRTSPTYRDYLRTLESEWQPFRRALRRQYQADFDRLFDRARDHADAAGYANGADPEFAFLLSVLLAQEVELRALRDRLDERDGDGGDGTGTGTGRVGPGPDTETRAPPE
jgi:hypothetical protein